jgi:hypothetical protein
LAHHSKNIKLYRLRKVEGSNSKYGVSSLWPTYTGERRTIFTKAYGIKVRCYGEHVGEHIGNQGKMKKKKSSPPHPHPPNKHKMVKK